MTDWTRAVAATFAEAEESAVPIAGLTPGTLVDWKRQAPAAHAAWIDANDFRAKPGTVLLLPDAEGSGRAGGALLGLEDANDLWSWGGAAMALPAGTYRIAPEPEAAAASRAALGWALGRYRFTRYRKSTDAPRRLVWPARADRDLVGYTAAATWLVRDLVNTAAGEMGPAELAEAAEAVARGFAADYSVTQGEQLLERNYPMIHAVGRASSREPRLIDIAWGDPAHPKVTIVGKGVCFDTGGLDIKGASSMLMMKKDMGGGAHALGLAHMIMAAKLPVRLRVLVPAVENSIDGNAFRPGDVLATRHGRTVEIGNTDAEGRLVLADALTAAMEDEPALVLDFATLTGAARVALGPELPVLFANDETLSAELLAAGEAESDPLWRLPLWQSYRRYLDSKVADINNAGESRYAGAITAALFLEAFVTKGTPWAHMDIFSWSPTRRAGRPEGGDALGMRAAFAMLRKRFG